MSHIRMRRYRRSLDTIRPHLEEQYEDAAKLRADLKEAEIRKALFH
jgi:hypothetical protein